MSVPLLSMIQGGSAVKIRASLESAITGGRLPSGDRLPPVRALARDLGCSPATVASAYAALRDRGLVLSEGRRGTFVSPRRVLDPRSERKISPETVDLASGNPDPELLPDHSAALAAVPTRPRLYGEPIADEELLREARRRFEADGIPAEHVGVAGGALEAMERVLRLELRPGDRVLVEDPGYVGVFDLLAGLGLRVHPVAIDGEGLVPDSLDAGLRRSAAAVVCTPRAQNPTGAALGADRAAELREVLSRHPATLVITDDHAGEIAGAPSRPIHSPETRRWVAIRSVSKSLGPDLRVALLAGDETTLRSVGQQQRLGMRWVSHVLQRLVAELWKPPRTNRRLEQAREVYARRRRALLDALLDVGVEGSGATGLNVWIPVREEGPLVRGLEERGWATEAGERFRLRSGPGIRVTCASLTTEEAARFASDFADSRRTSPRSAHA